MRHDAQQLKSDLTIDDIRLLLSELGAINVPDYPNNRGELITNTICHNEYGGSHKLYYSDERKSFHCFTECSESFDIYGLVERVHQLRNFDMHFSDIVDYVARKTGRSFGFGSTVERSIARNEEMEWLNKFTRREIEYPPLETYSDKILDVFSPHLGHPEFTEDGISVEAMDTFDIRYYNTENAIVIPHRNIDGDIVGLMQRNLDEHAIANGAKYMPSKVQGKLLSFSKHQNLYGLHENLSGIEKIRKVIIFEAEKSVLQTYTYFGEDCYAVAIAGSNISQYQIDLLLGLDVAEVQIALDKEFKQGDEQAERRHMEKVVKMGRRLAPYVKVTVLWDTEGLLEYQDSPSDQGKEVLLQLLASKQEILNKDEESIL